MTRQMFDSVNPLLIPADAQMVAGYLQGPYAWSAAGWARFPHARHVQIATVVHPYVGVVLDVERGDAAPDLAPLWCVNRRAAGIDPTVYCSAAAWDTVRAAFVAHDVAQPHYWIAHYGVAPVVPAGAVALQYDSDAAANYDISVVLDYWPGVDPAPQPTPTPQGSADMWLYQDEAGTIWMIDGSGRVAFQHVADVDHYLTQGVKLYTAAMFTPEWNATIVAKYPAR